MRVNTNVSQRAQQQLVLDNFGGVDFSSSPLLMASNRASYACNLINDNGVNHKRPGWEEQFKLGSQVNGIYHYKANGKNVLIVYAGKTFYECSLDGKSQIDLKSDNNWVNGRVQFYPQRDKVYIIGCGDYLVYGYFDGSYAIKRVVDTDVYVPTTTIHGMVISVNYKDDDYNDSYIPEIDNKQGEPATLDGINVFVKRRKNTFRGSNSGQEVYYLLDSRFKKDGIKKITVEYQTSIKDVDTGEEKVTCYSKELIDTNKMYFWGYDEAIETYTGVGFERSEIKAYTATNPEGTTIKSKITIDDNGKFYAGQYLDKTYANVTIEYEPYYEDGKFEKTRDMVTNCRFGTLFGAGGNSDRLFLSGNPDYPNADFYSEFDDYTYFTAQSQTVMGSDDVPITGYVRLSDSTLATMKAGAVYEPSIYYRKAIETDAYIDEEKTVKKIGFTKWSGGTGEACISPHVISSLAEDDLILSPNGVFGIVEVNNLQTNNRYMRERSAFINGKLLNEPRLSEAVSFVYKNRYYLAVPTDAERNGAVYVADPRFKSYRSDDIDSSFNYEWWYWENVPARVFAIIDGELWFGCTDGRVCRFDDKFTDRVYNCSANITIGDGFITYDKDLISDVDGNDGISIDANGVKYLDGEKEIEITKEDVFFVTELDEENCKFKIAKYEGGPALTLVAGSSEVEIIFHHKRNVVSTWYTPVFSLGATDVLKTLLRMTISVDPIIKGEVKFGYETRDIQRLLTAKVNPVIDFEAFSFEEFSFAADFATSYTVKSKARKFNYIMFKFISDNDRDCAINNFKAIYTLTASHRGVF